MLWVQATQKISGRLLASAEKGKSKGTYSALSNWSASAMIKVWYLSKFGR